MQLVLTRSSGFSRTLHTRTDIPIMLRLGKYFLMGALFIVIGFFSFLYLVKFTEVHTKGYELRKLELERERLLNIKEIQTTEIARQRSLIEVRKSAIASTMVPAAQAVFVTQDSAIAKR